MRLRKINYGDLSGRQKEAFNFQKVAGLLAEYGYNCIKLATIRRAWIFWPSTRMGPRKRFN